jgi:hypothetical protein
MPESFHGALSEARIIACRLASADFQKQKAACCGLLY